MAVFVDDIREWPVEAIKPGARHCGRKWARLWSDDVAALHRLAHGLGLKREWFADGFYPVTPEKRRMALAMGAESGVFARKDG